jgi:hypothetical protein
MSDHIENCIAGMRAPSAMQIICIDVTNKCDLACSNCTRLLENQEGFWDMSPDNFRQALRSIAEFPGIRAVIGGNPCMHARFPQLCEVIVEEVPDKSLRGLWTNNFFKHRDLAVRTFGVMNLNPHNVKRGIESLAPVAANYWYHAGTSVHSPVLTAVRDLYDETTMWERISACDVNRNWSATLIQNKGRLRAYFCEVAASFDLARGEDHGLDPVAGWWTRPIRDFTGQIRHFCPGCGVPARLTGQQDTLETDYYTRSNEAIALRSKANGRKAHLIAREGDLGVQAHKVTEYSVRTRPLPSLKRLLRRLRKLVAHYLQR